MNAIAQVRKLIKRQPSYRQEMGTISKAEEKGEPGAREAREHLVATFQKSINAVERSISETETRSRTAETMSLAFRHPTLPQHPLSRACHLLAVPAPRMAGLAALAEHTARKSADIAADARDRFDEAEPILRASATLALFLAKLPAHKFNRSSPALSNLRRDLHQASELSKKASQK